MELRLVPANSLLGIKTRIEMKLSGISVFAAAIFMLFFSQSGEAADLFEPRKTDPWSKAQSRLMQLGNYDVEQFRWYVRRS